MIPARFTILLFLFSNSIYAQSDRVQYSLDYCLSRTANADNVGGSFEPSVGHSIFARVGFGKKSKLKYTLGLGYLQSHIIDRDYSGMASFEDEERHYKINYFVVPAGIKFYVGAFYIHPEIGGSYNYNIHFKSYLVDSEMNRLDEIYSESRYSNTFELEPIGLLTIGYEFKLGSLMMLSGVNGYLAYNPDFIHTYGVGLLLGVKI